MTTTLFRERQLPHRSATHRVARFIPFPALTNKEYTAMLMHEELARERIRDMLQSAAEQREARAAGNTRRWARVVGWAQRRAYRNRS